SAAAARRGGSESARHRPAHVAFWIRTHPQMLTAPFSSKTETQFRVDTSSGEIRGRRATLAVEEPVPSPAPPVRARQWITHAMVVLHGQTPARIGPCGTGLLNSSE